MSLQKKIKTIVLCMSMILLSAANVLAAGDTVSDSEGLAYLIFMILLYFIPTIVSGIRRHANHTPILLTNLFVGWTFIGWFVALVWSTTNNIKPIENVDKD